MVFTSGSTGTRKGVVIEHRLFATNALRRYRSQVLPAKARVLQLASPAFDASIAEILFTLVAGGCACVPREVDRYTNIVEYVRYFAVNVLDLTPSVARGLQPEELPHLRTLIPVGEPMNEGDIAAWTGNVDLVNAYGPSECFIETSSQQPVTISTDHRNTGIAPCASCWIVDPENHNTLLPIVAVGELLVEGPIVGRRYLNEPEKTAAEFITAPPWLQRIRGAQPHDIYKTSDLVQYAPHLTGSCCITGESMHKLNFAGSASNWARALHPSPRGEHAQDCNC